MNADISSHSLPQQNQIPRDLEFEFTGSGWEYFKIWIVNIILSILTLGVYSAWAKVRTQQYFYGNTSLDKASFRYTAKPLTILFGRIIAVVAFIAYSLAQEFMPALAIAMIAAFVIALPAIIVRAMVFKLTNSVYRSVAFGFERSYKQAYAVFLGPMVAFVVLMALVFYAAYSAFSGGGGETSGLMVGFGMLAYMLGLPFFAYLAAKFYVNNSRYGDSTFNYSGGAGGFYKLYGMTFLVGLITMIPVAVIMGIVSGAMGAWLGSSAEPGSDGGMIQAMPQLFMQAIMLLVIIPAYAIIFAYFKAKRFNLIYNHSRLAGVHGFHAHLDTNGLAWLYLSNTLLIILTLGLAIPWAMVRSARYHLNNIDFVAADDLDDFAAAQPQKTNALGDEMGEVFSLDVGI